MRCLDRNKTKIIYALYDGMVEETETVDGVTYKTGRRSQSYKDAVITGGNIDENGRANYYPSGTFSDFLLNIVMDADCPFDPLTVLWIGYDADYYKTTVSYNVGDYCVNGTVYRCVESTRGAFDSTKWVAVPHNYIVKEVHHSLNNVRVFANENQN